MGLKKWLYQINERINEHARMSAHPYLTFAIFGIITYPLYYYLWIHASSTGYDNLWLRLIVVLLCVILALKSYWPEKLKRFLPLYWYLTLLYSLPFLFTFFLLKNELSHAAVLNTMSVLVLSVLLLDTMALSIILPLGIGLGILVFWLDGGLFNDKANHMSILITYGSVIFFGALFSYRKDQLIEAEKKLKKTESERLRIEVASKKRELESQKKFNKTASQVAHDIRSPLASLLMIVKSCDDIPEIERVALREASQSINDIADGLLSQYKPVSTGEELASQSKTPILLSAVLLQILTDKKFQFKERQVKFSSDFSSEGQFAFISCPLTSFKRMMSNLINNAVEALEGLGGEVGIELDVKDNSVKLRVIDNGTGMPEKTIEAFHKGKEIISGKETGHGLGLSQVRETVDVNDASLEILSKKNEGTKVILTFPRLKAPAWIAEQLTIKPDDIIIILDDDRSIHGAWDSRLEGIMKNLSALNLKHFQSADKTLKYIEALTQKEKERILFLTDYELVKQELNGLDVVEKAKVRRAILVTSHYMEQRIQKRAVELGVHILPKLLASEIPISFENEQNKNETLKVKDNYKRVDVILVDDDKSFAKSLMNYVFTGDEIDYFDSPSKLLDCISQYSKKTRIYMDNTFENEGVKGIEITQKLNDMGFVNLYLLSGEKFKPEDIPEYLKVKLKTDVESIKDW